jgi:hypothetical protein
MAKSSDNRSVSPLDANAQWVKNENFASAALSGMQLTSLLQIDGDGDIIATDHYTYRTDITPAPTSPDKFFVKPIGEHKYCHRSPHIHRGDA